MKAQQLTRYRFDYTRQGVIFDVFFFIDETPFVLLFGVKKENFAFSFKVEKGFKVYKPFIDNYSKLCKVLGLEYDPNNPFSPSAFLENFNSSIPESANTKNKITLGDMVIYRRDVEEADKIYFCGWLDNTEQGNKVSEGNLQKTLKWLGGEWYNLSLRKNVSTRWTDIKEKEKPLHLPKK